MQLFLIGAKILPGEPFLAPIVATTSSGAPSMRCLKETF